MTDYIRYLRGMVGASRVILNFAGCCVVNERGEILLQQRGGGDELWGFPGGAVEYGESFKEAAKREVREETGIEVEIGDLVGLYSKHVTVYPNGDEAQTICAFFLARPVGGAFAIDGEETLALRYFDLAKTPLLFNDQHRRALDDLVAGRRGEID